MSATIVKLCLLSLLVHQALGGASFSCGTRNGGYCGHGLSPNIPPVECSSSGSTLLCDQACGKIVINNQLGQWALVNETLTAINMHHPMTLTYQPITFAPKWTLQLATDNSVRFNPAHYQASANNEGSTGGTITFDSDWNARPDASKKHMLAMALYSITGQCFSDIQPGHLQISWANKYMGQAATNMMNNATLNAVLANQYSNFFVTVDQQFSVQECMALGGPNRITAGTQGNVNNPQFLTFKPTNIKVYFKNPGPGFAGLVFTRSDNSLSVPQNFVPGTLSYWEVNLADNEYISAFRSQTGPGTTEVTCIAFGITTLDGKYRDVGGFCSDLISNPYSFAFNYAGTWMMTKKCFY